MRSAAPVTQNHLSKKPEDMMLQNATPREICVCHAKCIFVDTLQRSHACHRFWKCCQTHNLLTFCKVQHPARLPHKTTVERPKALRATRACTFSTSQLRKVVRTWCAFHTLTFKFASRHGRALFQRLNFQECSERGVLCTFWLQNDSICASRHNGVHFFNIWASRSVPRKVCFGPFDFEMCFAPQRHALFQQLNVQNCSDAEVFLPFWLGDCFAPQRRAILDPSSRQTAPHPRL